MENIVHLALIWSGVFCSGYLAAKTKLTPVLYFLAVGCLFANLGWLPAEGTPFIEGLSEVGIILIMFALGFEEDSTGFVKSIKRTWGIALFGALAPFAIAYSTAMYFWGDHNMAIIVGLAMTATAVSLTMVSLKSEGLHKTRAATGIMTSAVLDVIASLALLAILIPVAVGGDAVSLWDVEFVVLKVIGFFVIVTVAGLWIFPSDIQNSWFQKVPLLGKYGVKEYLFVSRPENTTLAIVLLAVLAGLLAHEFGFHVAVGAYMAGLILRKEYFSRLDEGDSRDHYENSRNIIDNVAFTWIGPVFFVALGSKLIFDLDILIDVIPQTIVLTVGLLIGQVLSASIAARYTGGFSFEESILIGCGMLGRAELAFVVMNIAYIQYQIFTTEVFYTLMFTAFWLNLAVPLAIKLWKPRFQAAHPDHR
jgi:Kef-type K+ transport system membrane component KefB